MITGEQGRGNPQALFGKRPTEKDPAKGTSPAVDFTLREPGGAIPSGHSPGPVSGSDTAATAKDRYAAWPH
jgi:hypothetical protein